MIIALCLTAIVMIFAFFIASLIPIPSGKQEEGTSHELWLYGLTLMSTTFLLGILFLLFF